MMRPSRATAAALALAALACSESTVPADSAPSLGLVSGAGQRALSTDTLPEYLVVRMTDDAGRPVAGATVTWTSSNPGARFVPPVMGAKVAPTVVTTDQEGLARAAWVLGIGSGIHVAEASVVGWDDRVSVTAEALPGFKATSLMQGLASHMCALDAEARAWCWGANLAGELGNAGAPGAGAGQEIHRAPVRVHGDHRFRMLVGETQTVGTSCGITESDELWCWGSPNDVFGGLPTTGTPVRIADGMSFRSIDMTLGRACAVTPANQGYCWGSGVLGDGLGSRQSDLPVLVAGGHAWRQIVTDEPGTCGITLDGDVLCWTDQESAVEQLGLQGTGPFLVPTPISGLPKFGALSMNWTLQCGLLNAGTSAVCWGWGYAGPPPSPHFPVPLGSFRKLTGAVRSSAGLDMGGAIWLWGDSPACCHVWLSEPLKLDEGPWIDVAATGTGDGIWAILASDSTVYKLKPGYDGPVTALAVPALEP